MACKISALLKRKTFVYACFHLFEMNVQTLGYMHAHLEGYGHQTNFKLSINFSVTCRHEQNILMTFYR